MPPLCRPHFGEDSVAFGVIGIDFRRLVDQVWAKFGVPEDAFNCLENITVTDSESHGWIIVKTEMGCGPLPCFIWLSVDYLMQSSNIVE